MSSDFLRQTLHPPVNFCSTETKLNNGTVIKQHAIGLLEVIPPDARMAMVISAGIHGNETAPIELVNQLVNIILTEKITTCCRTLFIIAHPEAILREQRYIDTNLNRLFFDKNNVQKDSLAVEIAIAKGLQRHLRHFYQSLPKSITPWHLDLHSTIRQSQHACFAIIPSSATNKEKLLTFCQQASLEAALLAKAASHTFSWWSGHYYQAIAATVELGRIAPLYHNDLAQYQGFYHALVAMLSGRALSTIDNKDVFTTYQVSRTLYKQSEDFAFAFADDTANFTFFEQGSLIAKQGGQLYHAKDRGEAVVFPNSNVELGQRALLLVTKAERNR